MLCASMFVTPNHLQPSLIFELTRVDHLLGAGYHLNHNHKVSIIPPDDSLYLGYRDTLFDGHRIGMQIKD